PSHGGHHDPLQHYPLLQQRNVSAAFPQHSELQPEPQRLDVRSQCAVSPAKEVKRGRVSSYPTSQNFKPGCDDCGSGVLAAISNQAKRLDPWDHQQFPIPPAQTLEQVLDEFEIPPFLQFGAGDQGEVGTNL